MNPFPVRLRTALLAALLLPATLLAGQRNTVRFWLQNTVTHDTFGPVVRQTGYRFQAGTSAFVVLDSSPGTLRLARLPNGERLVPCDIVPGRILDLGDAAYTIINVQDAVVPDLPPEMADLSAYGLNDPTSGRQRTKIHRRDLPVSEWPLRVGGWIEPTRSVRYDWTVGGFAGKKAHSIKSTRIGARAEWGNAFLQAGIAGGGKQSGSLTPPMTALDHLTISGGSGISLSAGWIQPFIIDDSWDLLVGGIGEWASESYDLNAHALVRTERPKDADAETLESGTEGETESAPEGAYYEYRTVSSSLDLSEIVLAAVVGIEYHQDFWGARAMLRADLFSDVSTSGSITLDGTRLAVSGERADPLLAEFGAWCYWIDQLRSDVTVQLGAVNSLRVAVLWEF